MTIVKIAALFLIFSNAAIIVIFYVFVILIYLFAKIARKDRHFLFNGKNVLQFYYKNVCNRVCKRCFLVKKWCFSVRLKVNIAFCRNFFNMVSRDALLLILQRDFQLTPNLLTLN